jgi:iron(III) transport system ATP-binding protein
VTSQSAAQRNVSLVFQSYALFPHMSVMENVCYGLTVQKMKKPDAEARANEAIKLLGLTGFERRLPSELSGGQQQRVAIARALVLEPAVLLFDEPLSNLDTKLRRHVREEIRELQQRLKLTCVYVTHDREEAMAVSDQIIVMGKGVITEMGTPGQLFFAPRTSFVADFLSEANVLPATVTAVANGRASIELGDARFEMAADAGAAAAVGAATVALRPDVFTITKDAAVQPSLSAVIRKSSFIGKGVEVVADTSVGELFVFLPHEKLALPVGEEVHLAFPPDEARLTV